MNKFEPLRRSKKYSDNLDYCKDFVENECFCMWEQFCLNAYDLYKLNFIEKLYNCNNNEDIQKFVHTVI